MSRSPHVVRRGRLAATRFCLVAAAAAVAVAGLAIPAGAARPAKGQSWDRISGPSDAGQQLGLARVQDGTLHVIWNQGGGGSPATIHDTRLAPSGHKIGTTTVATDWDGAGGLALLAMPDGTLQLFATGGHTLGLPSPEVGVNVLTGQANGSGWSLEQGAVWGGAPAGAAPFVSAALTKDGQPVTAWAGAGVSNFQVGVAGGGIGTPVCSCAASSAEVATDAGSGAVVMAGQTIDNPSGTYVEQALPSITNRTVLPSATQSAEGDFGITGRIGAPGVYVAYTDGNRPGVSKPKMRLYKYGGPTTTIAGGPFTVAKAFAGPSGRLWLVWGDAAGGLFVTRSNQAVNRFEPVQKMKSPSGASFLWNAQGDGSTGALDVFVDASTADGRGFWHTHVLARDSLKGRVSARHKGKQTITLTLTDAGDPLAGASITASHAGRVQHLKTNASGTASLTVHGGGTITAIAVVPTYANARISLHLKGR